MDATKISISGDLGSGKSVLARRLESNINFKLISVGVIQRKLAQKYGLSTTEFNKYMETHSEIDIECDNMVSEYGKSNESIILDSRLAWHFVPQSFKIHLIVNRRIAGQRIFNDTVRENEKYQSIEETIQSNIVRRSSEVLRFKQQYHVDIDNLNNYDLVIDTSFATPEEIFNLVIIEYTKWKEEKRVNKLWLSPKNIFPTDKLNDQAKVYQDICESIISSGFNYEHPVTVIKSDGSFLIFDGHKRISAAIKSNLNLIPCKLIGRDDPVFGLKIEFIFSTFDQAIIEEWETVHGFKFLESINV
jgi:cytidylate kinase